MTGVAGALVLLAQVPVQIEREPAREAARDELAKRRYAEARPGFTERILEWLFDRLSDLLDRAAGISPGGYAGLAVTLLVIVAGVVAIRLKVGPLGRSAGRDEALFLGRPRSAAEHRTAAESRANAGEWAEAVRERLRAVVRALEERALLEPRPGRTAHEAAAEAGLALPTCAAGLRGAADAFDDIWYGGRPATAAAYDDVRRVDEQVQVAKPAREVSAS